MLKELQKLSKWIKDASEKAINKSNQLAAKYKWQQADVMLGMAMAFSDTYSKLILLLKKRSSKRRRSSPKGKSSNGAKRAVARSAKRRTE